jgi:hypothetical protein
MHGGLGLPRLGSARLTLAYNEVEGDIELLIGLRAIAFRKWNGKFAGSLL